MALHASPLTSVYVNSDESDGPCVRNCCLDNDDICLGCGRALNEITGWNAATEAEKQEILGRAKERLSKRKYSWPQ